MKDPGVESGGLPSERSPGQALSIISPSQTHPATLHSPSRTHGWLRNSPVSLEIPSCSIVRVERKEEVAFTGHSTTGPRTAKGRARG